MTILGMLGGGQLGRMAALAAARLGIETHVYCPETDQPAHQVTPHVTTASYQDWDALKRFAQSVHCITYEFENIPLETVQFLEGLRPVYPSSKVLGIAQDRIAEKSAFQAFGLPTTRFAAASNADDVLGVLQDWNVDAAIVKTTRFGYDGKGQAKVTRANAAALVPTLKSGALIVESIVPFVDELSVIVARDRMGNVGCYDVGLNVHKNHILDTTTVPCGLPDAVQKNARDLAISLAQQIDLIGVLGVELFLTVDGGLLLNEIAPRPHNSGHWTIDACLCSQFEQQVRAACGLPLGSFERHSNVRMLNLIGDDIVRTGEYLHTPNAAVHLYGKREARPGRKMGHVNFLSLKE